MSFVDYVEARSVRVPFSGCAIWTGSTTPGGYGTSIVAARLFGTTVVHKALFQALHGQVPKGMYVCHHCDTPACVNPEHLFLGSPSDNAQDRKRKGRSASRRGDCNGKRRLNSAQVDAIRQRLASGEPLSILADAHGVSISAISHIKHGRTWGEAN
jgi:hypothetical protein